jgi:hypothetical protein
MRWLVVHPAPSFSVADVYAGYVEALRDLGQQVVAFNLDARLTMYEAALVDTGDKGPNGEVVVKKLLSREQAIHLATQGILSAAYKAWPDVVLVVSGFFLDADLLDLLRSRGHRVVLLHTEEPYEHSRQLALSQHADLSLLNDPTNLDAYRAQGQAEYLPHAYRPRLHHPGPPTPELVSDLAFVGTGYGSRIRFLESMRLEGLDVLLAGNWQLLGQHSPLRKYLAHDEADCLDNDQTVEVYRSARVGLNLYRREAESPEQATGWAVGPREIEMAAVGLPFLRDPRGEGDRLFGMLPTFTSPGEASERLRWWLDHPDQRARAALEARVAVADRTFDNNARTLLRLLDRAPARN